MGVVYRAHDSLLEREVALKIIATSIEANPELRERFFREARAAGQLSHRNIITIHDLGEHEGQPYLAMEFLTGEDLQHRLARQEPMGLRRKLEIAAEICDGLAYAHRRGLIHRDVKPANIFITDEGVVKLLDFGLARMVASELTRSNMMMGTLNYMAPEQVRGERTDHRADIFSFGVVLYEMLSGRKAFQGDSFATTLYKILQDVPEPLPNIDPTLPAELVWLVERTLAKPKDERYQDLADVTRDLALIRQLLSGPDAQTMPVTGLGGMRVPSDPPRPSASRPGSGSRLGSGNRPGSGSSSAGTTFAATPPPLDRLPSGGAPASRSWGAVIGAGVVLAALVATAAWYATRPTEDLSRATPTSVPAAPPATSSVPPQPGAFPPPAPDQRAARQSPEELLRGQLHTAEEARDRMARAKTAARRAGNPATRSPAYAAAAAAEREGNRLYQARRFPDAAERFNEASGLFRGAELTLAGPAPQAAPPQRVDPPAAPAPAVPPQTTTSVQAPTPTLPTAETPVQLPPGAAPRVPPPPAPGPTRPQAPQSAAEGAASPVAAEAAIRELLTKYQRAMEARSIDELRRIWPTLPEEALRNEFRQARRLDVEIANPDVTVSGTSATATFVRRYQLLTTDNQRVSTNSRTTMTLRRSGSEWLIERVRFEAIR
jgi:serine/threonine protein kinase